MSAPVLLVDKSEGIATLTLNRPASRNALSRELRMEFVQALDYLHNDPGAGVVILTGAGKAFCAGLDLKELANGSMTLNPSESVVGGPDDVVQAMVRFDRPIIGAINGFAITGGFEVALACDVLIAATAAKFADTHVRVGAMPGWGLSQKLSRVIGIYRAKELSLTGNYLSAEQAAAWGLVNRIVAPEELLPTCRALAKDMLSCEPDMLRNMKRVINEGFAATLSEGLQIEHEASRAHGRQVTPEAIAVRRAAVQERGRAQSS
jgi:enoyl-CoA hydratase/carnithine racemase